ncbi:MAG: sulfatase [Pirellulales bacterium]|nr:sulfatase [Pirellulales bacterium]
MPKANMLGGLPSIGLYCGWIVIMLIGRGPVVAAEPERRPNVVWIVCDDLRCALSCYGDTTAQSPNIDRLAARGIRFDCAYCQYPVCNPSRTSFLSGLRPETTRVVDNRVRPQDALPDVVWLPEWFRQHGYRTIKAGKVFHTGTGFEDPPVWDVNLPEDPRAKQPAPATIERRQGDGGIVLNVADEDAWDGRLAKRGVDLLASATAGEQPFLLVVGFRRPHTPYMAPRRYFELFPPDAMGLPQEPAAHLAGIPAIALTYKPGTPLPSEQQRRETIAAYHATTAYLDALVGRLIAELDALRLWDNTLVVLTSDHGYHLYEHGGLLHKMTVFEQSARVPLIVVAPHGARAAASPRLVELVDLYPTLAEFCGMPLPEHLEGTSFVPLFDEPQRPWKSAAFTVVSHVGGIQGGDRLDPDRLGRSVRTEQARYTEWPDGSREYYDYTDDPHEFQNRAANPNFASAVETLRQALAQGWRAARPAVESKRQASARPAGAARRAAQ